MAVEEVRMSKPSKKAAQLRKKAGRKARELAADAKDIGSEAKKRWQARPEP
jgi:hypothetical protein